MDGVIYKITNKINGKVYIGKTSKGIEYRWKRHCTSGQCSRMKAAIDKYGIEAFTIEVIDSSNDLHMLNELECYWIAFYDSTNKEYNVLKGGNDIPALHHTRLTKEQELAIINLKEKGYTSVQLGKMYNVVPQTIANVFKKHHRELPFKNKKLTNRVSEKEFVNFMHIYPTLIEVKNKFNISKSGVYILMKSFNVPLTFLTSERTVKHNRYMEKYLNNVINLHNQHVSNRSISKILGIARQTVSKIIEYNISKSVQHPEEG